MSRVSLDFTHEYEQRYPQHTQNSSEKRSAYYVALDIQRQQDAQLESERLRISEEKGEEDIFTDQLLLDYAKEDKYKEYLVDGAVLRCTMATLNDFLVPDGRIIKLNLNTEVTSEDRVRTTLKVSENPMSDNDLHYATVKDTQQAFNIAPFWCNCRLSADRGKEVDKIMADRECSSYGVCRYLMDLNDEWDNMPIDGTSYLKKINHDSNNGCGGVSSAFGGGFPFADEEVEGITMTSVLFCRHGGVIYPETSGQIIQIIKGPTVSVKACTASGEHAGSLSEEQILNNAQYIYNYLEKQGWTMEAICGLLGNFYKECTMNPGAWNTWNNTNGAYGLAQWTGPDSFFDFSGLIAEDANVLAEENPQALMDLQLVFLEDTMKTGGGRWYAGNQAKKYFDAVNPSNEDCRTMTGEEFIQSNFDVADLAEVFCACYERPTNDPVPNKTIIYERIDYAKLWYSYFSGENPDFSISDFEKVRKYWNS